MKEVLFGIEFDTTKGTNSVKKLRSDMAVESSHIFSELYAIGGFRCKELSILVNEVLRGRLYTTDISAVREFANYIKQCRVYDMPYLDIVLLRSVDFGFEEILKFAMQKKSAEDVLLEYGLEDIDVENVNGLTSGKQTEWFVTYDSVKKYIKRKERSSQYGR